METSFKLDPEQKQIKQIIFPYLKALTYELIKTQPQQIEQFMIDFLTKQGNYTTSGLTRAEKKELEFLRVVVKRYRDLEKHNVVTSKQKFDIKKEESISSDDSCSEENDDVMDEKEENELINKKLTNIKNTQEKQNMMKARISVSAEAYGLYNKKQNYVPKVVPKNEDQMNRIKGKIISSFIFSSLDKKDLEVVINAMEEKRYKLKENVITQGEDGDCLYIVETGSLKCFKTFKTDNSQKFLKNYGPGDSFGELALLYNCPRAASIVCSSEESILWSLDRETFNNIVKDAAQKKREKYEKFLKNVNILSTIDSYELGQICDSLKDGIFKKDEYIIREGELGDIFYILEEGTCNATKTLEPGKEETIINELKEGDYFGERALLRGEPRYANIVVSSETAKVISLDRRSFNRLLGPIMDILKRNMEQYQIYCSNNNENENNNNNYNNFASNSNTNSKINLNNNNNNKLSNLNNIITSDNNNNDNKKNININNNNNNLNNLNNIITSEENNYNNNENNQINFSHSDDKEDIINDNNNNNELINNDYNNIDVNKNINNIITSDNNNNNNLNMNNENKNIYHNNNGDNNPININNDNDIENNENEVIQIDNIDNENNEDNNNENDKENNIDNNNNNKLPSLMDALTKNVDIETLENNDNNNKDEEKENVIVNEKNDIEDQYNENIESNKNENKNEENEPKKELQSLADMLVGQNNEEMNNNQNNIKAKTSGIKMELANKDDDDSDYDVL